MTKNKSTDSLIQAGDNAIDFTLPADGGCEITLSSFKGKNIVLYFYPKDDTPGCTAESKEFRDKIDEFTAAGSVVIGLSKDSVKSHDKFKCKYDLPFALVSDESTETIKAYGSWVQKSMYGKKYMGVDRSTFLIDKDFKLAGVWRNVSVPGHVDEVLAAVKGTAS